MRALRWMAIVGLCANAVAAGVTARADGFAVVGGPALAAGHNHSLVLRANGTVVAFGENFYGQLGTTTNIGVFTGNPTPTVVPGLTGVIAIAAGYLHSLALRSNGTVVAFGFNVDGQLGRPGLDDPSPMVVPGLTGVIAIAASDRHSLALKDDGTVVAFGGNNIGQLGTTTNTGSTPTVVPGLSGVTAIAAGRFHNLALKSDGTVVAFGGNIVGQLGTTTNIGTANPNPPTVVPGLNGVTAIAAGAGHSLALKGDGTVVGFGSNDSGQLGEWPGGSNPTRLAIPGLAPVTAIAAGFLHTVIRQSDGSVVTFGENVLGQLGRTTNIGSFGANPTPTAVAGVVAASLVPGSRFVAVSPTRILDTRPTNRLNYSGAKPSADSTTAITVVGRAGVPPNAVAVTANVTAVDATGPGYVQVLPSTSGVLRASSNLNVEFAGQAIANAVTVPLGTDGAIRLYTERGAHLLVDITGYFVPATGPTAAGRMVTVTPTRLLDTRSGAKPAAGSTTRVPVAARGQVPADIAAVVLNVTAVDATAPGFIQVGPAGATTPFAWSNINIGAAGQTIPNQVIVAVSVTGAIDLFAEAGAHLLVDIFGYFTTANATPGTNGLFVPIPPTRTLDTRNGPKPGPGSIISNNPGALPEIPTAGTSAVAANITITQASGPGYVQAAATGTLVIAQSSILNATRTGQTIPNAAVIPTAPASFDLYTEVGGHLIADIFGYYTN